MGELNLELTGPLGMSPGVGGMLVRANAAATAAAVVVPKKGFDACTCIWGGSSSEIEREVMTEEVGDEDNEWCAREGTSSGVSSRL